ncbi:hypothetical protein Tco_0290746 [Tanacetum coccineum]
MLKVSPRKGVIHFGKPGKLNPLYIGPFKILEWICPVAYKLELPEELSNVHSTFHISNLKKCISDESLVIPMKEIRLDDKLNFVEEPIKIMDQEVKQLKQSHIPIVKVRWNSKRGPEFTWECEDQIRSKSKARNLRETDLLGLSFPLVYLYYWLTKRSSFETHYAGVWQRHRWGKLRCKGVTKQIVGVVPKGLVLQVVLVDLHSKDESGKGFKLELRREVLALTVTLPGESLECCR